MRNKGSRALACLLSLSFLGSSLLLASWDHLLIAALTGFNAATLAFFAAEKD